MCVCVCVCVCSQRQITILLIMKVDIVSSLMAPLRHSVPVRYWDSLLLNVPATGYCISGTDLLRQVYVLPH